MAKPQTSVLFWYRDMYASFNSHDRALTLAALDLEKGYCYGLTQGSELLSTAPNRLEVIIDEGIVRSFGQFSSHYPSRFPWYINELARAFERQVLGTEVSVRSVNSMVSTVHKGLLYACPSWPLAIKLAERDSLNRLARVQKKSSSIPAPK